MNLRLRSSLSSRRFASGYASFRRQTQTLCAYWSRNGWAQLLDIIRGYKTRLASAALLAAARIFGRPHPTHDADTTFILFNERTLKSPYPARLYTPPPNPSNNMLQSSISRLFLLLTAASALVGARPTLESPVRRGTHGFFSGKRCAARCRC